MTPKLVLIVARAGPLGNSLCSLMASLDEISIVAECTDMASFMRLDSRTRPDLILVEPDLADSQLRQTIRHIKQQWPSARSIVLVNRASQRQAARDAGAHVVLFKGCRAADLVENAKSLLVQNPERLAKENSISANFAFARIDK